MTDEEIARWEADGGAMCDPALSRRALAVEQLNRAIPALQVTAKLLQGDDDMDISDQGAAVYLVLVANRLRDQLMRPVVDAVPAEESR